jgi:hypothetical protein
VLGRRWKIARAWIYYGLAVAIYAIVFGVWQVQPVPLEVHAAGVLVAAICMFPMALWYVQGSKGLPMFELVCIAYLLEFANPVYLQPNSYTVFSNSVPFGWDEALQGLLLVALGVGSMIAGYYAVRRSRLRRRLPHVDLPLDPQRRPRFIVAALVFGAGTYLLQTVHLTPDNSGPLGAAVRIVAAQFSIAIILLAYRLYRRETVGIHWYYLLYGSVALSVALGLATGFLEPVLVPLVLLFVIRWHVTGRFQARWLLVGFVAFVLLQSVKAQYRQAAWQSGVSLPSRITLWLELPGQVVQNTFTGDASTNVQTLVRQSMARFDIFHPFEWVHRETPSVVPYYSGASYEYLLYGWIPRAVWPDKPIAQEGQLRFELDYHILTQSQLFGASIGLGQISEAYANFDWLGILIVLAVQGAFFALLNEVFNGPESDGGRAIYLWIMVTFLNGIGTDTTTIFGSVVQNSLAAAVILRLFSTGWRARGAQAPAAVLRRRAPTLRGRAAPTGSGQSG